MKIKNFARLGWTKRSQNSVGSSASLTPDIYGSFTGLDDVPAYFLLPFSSTDFLPKIYVLVSQFMEHD